MNTVEPRWLTHSRMSLALWTVRTGDPTARPLLLLHGLGEHTTGVVPEAAEAWPGPVLGLDFTGHGASSVPTGGGYTSEILVGDADTVLAEVGPVTAMGRGLGAWVGLLLAGARPTLVRGMVLCDGPGIVGGGNHPGSPAVPAPYLDDDSGRTPDPWALVELSRDVRPPGYATRFVRAAVEGAELEDPITVCCVIRPEWVAAVAAERGVDGRSSAAEALARYARLP